MNLTGRPSCAASARRSRPSPPPACRRISATRCCDISGWNATTMCAGTWSGRPRLGRAHLARRARRHRLERAATADLRGRVLQGGRAEAAALRPVHDRTGADEVRQRRAAGRAAAAHHPRAGLVVPGLFGAGFGFGPPRCRPAPSATAASTWSTARRPGPRWRNTPTACSAGPHRSRRARPARHFHAAAGHASARRQRASDPDAGRWLRRQRSLAGKRARAGRQPGGEENQGWTYASTCSATSVPASPGSGIATASWASSSAWRGRRLHGAVRCWKTAACATAFRASRPTSWRWRCCCCAWPPATAARRAPRRRC